MPEPGGPAGGLSAKAQRRQARELIAAYHRDQLRVLLDHVRDGFARLDSGGLDEFELDDLIHHYKRAARKLWTFCGSSGSQWLQAANALTYLRARGEEPDWWADVASRDDRRSHRSSEPASASPDAPQGER